MKLHLVYNPKSGRGKGAKVCHLAEKLCNEAGAEFVRHEITDPEKINDVCGGAVKSAKEDGGIVVATGGDGTVRAVAHQAKNTDVRVAVVPGGTFNLFARTHGIPEDFEMALRLALKGEAKPIRLAMINDETFILNASFGLYAKAIRERKTRTKKFGRHRFVAIGSTLMSMVEGHSTMNISIAIDGKPRLLKTTMVFIGNNALQLRDLSLDVANCMKEDKLAVVTMKNMSGWKMARLAFHGLKRTLESLSEFDSFCADSLKIETSSRDLEVALDGEMFKMKSPLQIQAVPHCLLLIKR